MNPVSASVTIGRPREEVFDYLADIANHSEFSDHYLKDWRLTRENSCGRGAGARFRMTVPFNRYHWGDRTFVEVDAPFRIVEVGRSGKNNRVRSVSSYTLSPGPGGTTRVDWTGEMEPSTLSDRLVESLGARRWLRRNATRGLRRLRAILEEGEERGRRATVAGL